MVHGSRGTKVHFSRALVLPVLQRAEEMDVTAKRLTIVRKGREGLICKDNIRADLEATFLVSVGRTEEEILHVARSVGCARASDLLSTT